EHWNGMSWSRVSSPNVGSKNSYLDSMAVVSASNIWAVGYYESNNRTGFQPLIEHWNGTRWSIVQSPSPAGSIDNELDAVTHFPRTNQLWTVGDYNGVATLTEFYC